MRNLIFIITIAIIAMTFSCKNSKYTYPETRKDTVVDNYFGTKVLDEYRWLEDDNSEETKKWVDAQNKVTFDYLEKIPFREKLKKRISEVMNYEKYSTPFKKAGRYFYFKNDGLQNQSIFYTLKNLSDEPEILLNPNKLSPDGTTALSNMAISKNGKYFAYSISKSGSDWNEILIRNIETKKDLNEKIKWVKFSMISWYKNGFFYSRYPAPKKGEELTSSNINHAVYYHRIGTKQSEDKLIFDNKEHPQFMYRATVSEDDKYIFISESKSTSGNGIYFKNLTLADSKFIKITENFKNNFAVIDHVNGKLLIKTNYKAPKYKVIAVDVNNYKKTAWKDLIPEQKNVLRWCIFGADKIIASYIENAYSKTVFYSFSGKRTGELKLPGIGTMQRFYSTKGDPIAFYAFSSYTAPFVIYKYDFRTGKSEIYKKSDIKGFNFEDYVTKQVFYKSKDGTKVSMFITHKKGIKLDGYNPTWLYGYGGFNVSLTPSFSVKTMIWLENGGVYAVANLRGGGEYGADWHKAGTKLNKQNVFDDFIAAAEYLIAKKYTTQSKLVIEGGSNGGLLIGAVINQRPKLFQVALAHVGVMDMLRYQNFTIGRKWASDYGLSEDSTMFNYLYKYSPYHNIKDQEYPAVLVLTADHDDRVVPAHSFKYIAKLQATYTGSNPVMIRIDKKAGHGAGKATSQIIDDYTDLYSFVFKNINKKPYKKVR